MARSDDHLADPKVTKPIPFISEWGKAPFFGPSDIFWNRVSSYDRHSFPRPDKEGLFLYATAYESRERSPSASSIPRIRIEKQEFPFSHVRFQPDSCNRLQGWQHWTDEILSNPEQVQMLKSAGIFHCIQLCKDRRIHQNQDALCTLLSRWCSSIFISVTA